MATFTGWFHRDNQPTQEIQFEASADLRNDKEELEQIESSGNDEAEIRYDGLKYFTVNAIY